MDEIRPQRAMPKSLTALRAEWNQLPESIMPIHHGGYPESHPAGIGPGDFEYDAIAGPTFAELQEANRERGKARGPGRKLPPEFIAMELGGEAGELIEALAKREADQMAGTAIALKVGRV